MLSVNQLVLFWSQTAFVSFAKAFSGLIAMWVVQA
jgi:hypothetical protein